MKRIFSLIIISILFTIIGMSNLSDVTSLSVFIYPFTIMGSVLRTMSTNGGALNVLSILIFLALSSLPVVFLLFKIKKEKIQSFEYIVLPLISILLGITLYYFINPHLLYASLNSTVIDLTPQDDVGNIEIILKSGVAYLLYLVIAIYLTTRTYYSKTFDSITIVKVLLYLIMTSIILAVCTISLSSMITTIRNTNIVGEKVLEMLSFILTVIISSLMLYLLESFRTFMIVFQKDGFQKNILISLKQVHKTSYILLISLFGSQVIKNLFQFVVLDKLLNISFTFEIPIFMLLLTSFIYLLSKYITKAIDLKTENELII